MQKTTETTQGFWHAVTSICVFCCVQLSAIIAPVYANSLLNLTESNNTEQTITSTYLQCLATTQISQQSLRDTLNTPKQNTIHITILANQQFADVFDVLAQKWFDTKKPLYISYDIPAIEPNSKHANILYLQDLTQHKTPKKDKNLTPNNVFAITAHSNKTFTYEDGQTALFVSWARISTDPQDVFHHQRQNTQEQGTKEQDTQTATTWISYDIPRYRHTHFPTQRLAYITQKQSENTPFDETWTMSDDFFVSQGTRYIDKDTWIVRTKTSRKLTDFLRVSPRKTAELLSLLLYDTQWQTHKIRRDRQKNTYVYPYDDSIVYVQEWDRVQIITQEWYIDVDSITSRPEERIGDVTACVKTKRMNLLSLGINIPYGQWAYKIANKDHASAWLLQDAIYVGASTVPQYTLDWFLKTKNNRQELLNPATFPLGTNVVSITWHSDSQAGREYGHTNMWFVRANKLWILDPYVQVPWYSLYEPKLMEDFMQTTKAQKWLSVAKVHYYITQKQFSPLP